MEAYIHTVQYYETDKMGIVHHSNYIRWMEEARVNVLKQIGWNLEKLEEIGISIPVTAIECQYLSPAKFGEEIQINLAVEEFKGVRLKLSYKMEKTSGDKVFEGRSEHCFLDRSGKILRINKEYPEFYQALCSLKNA